MALMTNGTVHAQYEARVLLLDDDMLFREAMTAMFGATQGMSVVASTDSPQTAFAMLGRSHPNVAIVNANMRLIVLSPLLAILVRTALHLYGGT